MEKQKFLSQRQAIDMLYKGYILENNFGHIVYLEKGRQKLSSESRTRPYSFKSRGVWTVLDRLSLWERLMNAYHLAFDEGRFR